MKVIIIDDEQSNQENLKHLLQVYAPDLKICATAGDINNAFNIVSLHQPDLVFLDIQLHAHTGFDLLKQLEEITFEVIFVTAYNQYGIEAIKFAALDYLLKPIDIDELKEAVNKARKAIQQKRKNERLNYLLDYLKDDKKNTPRIALPMFNEIRYVNVSDIVRCEADNTYTKFMLNNGEKILVSKTLKEYVEMLSRYGFIRSHQSHLINLTYIRSWLREDGGSLQLNDGTKIPVSKQNREKVKEALR
jgi:two-component system LytT family response regulator